MTQNEQRLLNRVEELESAISSLTDLIVRISSDHQNCGSIVYDCDRIYANISRTAGNNYLLEEDR